MSTSKMTIEEVRKFVKVKRTKVDTWYILKERFKVKDTRLVNKSCEKLKEMILKECDLEEKRNKCGNTYGNKPFTSNALWPKEAMVIGDKSTDGHDTKEAAESVCNSLEMEGLGGDGKIFPINTWVGTNKI